MVSSKRESFKLALILFWLVFTVAFALWWFYLSYNHVAELARLNPERAEHWSRQMTMLAWEGGSWMLLLVGGGVALIALVLREQRRVRQIREFFASFSHDVKTSLASLRVQAEALAEDWQGAPSPTLSRLVGDTVRLQLQLENSLFFASQADLKLFVERLRLSELVERMREQWPAIRVDLGADAYLRGDVRALRTVFSNLAKNAILHGRATEVSVGAEVSAAAGKVMVRFQDNGEGFEGSLDELGRLFHRPKATSGSGLGLYISRLLIEKMGGALRLRAGHRGFRVELEMPGELR